ELGPLVEELEQPVLVLRELEEPVLLVRPFHLTVGMDRTPQRAVLAADQLILALERLAADAIVALVPAALHVAALLHAAHELLRRTVVAWLARADEVVVADEQPLPGVTELFGDAVDPLLRSDARRLGALE